MNEFKYFIDIVPRRKYSPHGGFFWDDNGFSGLVFEQLEANFKACKREFEGYIMTLESKDRTVVSEKTLRELINAANESEAYRLDECAMRNVLDNSGILVEMALHNGIQSLFGSLRELRIGFTEDFLEWVNRQSDKHWIGCIVSINSDLPKTNQSAAQKCLVRFSKEENADTLMRRLVEGGFIDKETNLAVFLYWYGGENDFVGGRIDWLSTLKDLHVFVNTFYFGEGEKWKKAVACFTKNGVDINKSSLSTANASTDSDPKSRSVFESIRKEIR